MLKRIKIKRDQIKGITWSLNETNLKPQTYSSSSDPEEYHKNLKMQSNI